MSISLNVASIPIFQLSNCQQVDVIFIFPTHVVPSHSKTMTSHVARHLIPHTLYSCLPEIGSSLVSRVWDAAANIHCDDFFLHAMQVYRDRCVLHFFFGIQCLSLVYSGIRTLSSLTGLCSFHVLFKSQVDF